jgi:hypothetical protein
LSLTPSRAQVGNAIPPEFVAAIQKGFEDSVNKGPLTGSPIEVRAPFPELFTVYCSALTP